MLTGDFTCELSPRQAKSAYNRVSQTYAEKNQLEWKAFLKEHYWNQENLISMIKMVIKLQV